MFEVRCVVEDKRLPKVLRSLKELVMEPPVVIPVDDKEDPVADVGMANGRDVHQYAKPTKHKKPRIIGKKKTNKSSLEVMLDYIQSHTKSQLTRKEMVDELVRWGYVAGSQTYAFNKLREMGVLTQTDLLGVYDIHRGKIKTQVVNEVVAHG